MKVICKYNNINVFSNEEQKVNLRKYILNADGKINASIDKEYIVYGIVFRDGEPWFYLCSEEYDEYPTPFPFACFEIQDATLSKYWQLVVRSTKASNSKSLLVFREWAEDGSFYENLINDDIDAVNIFAKYRRLINEE